MFVWSWSKSAVKQKYAMEILSDYMAAAAQYYGTVYVEPSRFQMKTNF